MFIIFKVLIERGIQLMEKKYKPAEQEGPRSKHWPISETAQTGSWVGM